MPPPPMSLPSFMARSGPSDSGFSAPPLPSGLPGVPPPRPAGPAAPSKLPGPAAPTAAPAAPVPAKPAAPAPVPTGVPGAVKLAAPAPAPSGLPGASTSTSPKAQEVAEGNEEEEEIKDSWRDILEEGSSGDESEPEGVEPEELEDSGEDSDEAPPAKQGGGDSDRHKQDMEMLKRHQAVRPPAKKEAPKEVSNEKAPCSTPSKTELASEVSTVDTAPKSKEKAAVEEEEAGDVPFAAKPAIVEVTAAASPASASKKKGSILGRIFKGSPSAKGESCQSLPGGSLLEENINQHDDAWYTQHLARLGKDGIPCTKIATNGKPYERRILVDSRNLIVEIRGGRTGSTGILLDDLIDLRRGLKSPEFELFFLRITKDLKSPAVDIAERALVLQTPHRTFSFLLPSLTHRSTLAFCILFLLKSKNRGVMASGTPNTSTPSSRAPKQGHGSVVYGNRSTYEGQFQNHMRHGKGTLTLSDGTRYQSEWKNDERHGPGKEFCPDGTTFTGAYLNGMRHGQGTMTWPEGSKYSGQFERGRANGEGELLRTDGSVYRGHFHEDCMSGEGRMQWRDNVEYTGQFVGNRREGFGKMVWTSGKWKSYEGHWKDGMQHGAGTLCDHIGQEFRGIFKAGKLERWEEEEQY